MKYTEEHCLTQLMPPSPSQLWVIKPQYGREWASGTAKSSSA